MTERNAVIAVFSDYQSAESAVKKLADGGIDIKHLSVVGKGYHTDEKVVGFYNAGDRVKFWGKRALCVPRRHRHRGVLRHAADHSPNA